MEVEWGEAFIGTFIGGNVEAKNHNAAAECFGHNLIHFWGDSNGKGTYFCKISSSAQTGMVHTKLFGNLKHRVVATTRLFSMSQTLGLT